MLGARPALGRFFTTDDERCFCLKTTTEASVMVLSYDTWQRQFAHDSAIIGQQFTSPYTLHAYTVIGVAPPGLRYPAGVDYWMPQVYGGGLDLVSRLAPGATPSDARAEAFAVMKRIWETGHPEYPLPISSSEVRTFTESVVGNVRPAVRVLVAAVCLLLIIACVNDGNLLLLRVASRGQEIAVRRSLGATGAGRFRQRLKPAMV